MEYFLANYGDEKAEEHIRVSPEQMEAVMGAWFQYDDQIRKALKVISAHVLQPTSVATTIRAKDGQTIISDGPFAETKEQMGGYYVIDAKDLDEALEWATKDGEPPGRWSGRSPAYRGGRTVGTLNEPFPGPGTPLGESGLINMQRWTGRT